MQTANTYQIQCDIDEMRNVAKILLPFSFPLKSAQDEHDITLLKERRITLDGFDLKVYHSHALFGDVKLESVKFFARYGSFLPFRLVCKLGIMFFPDKELTLIEVIEQQEYPRKAYIWNVWCNKAGETIPCPFVKKITDCNFDNFHYKYINTPFFI